MRTPTGAMWFAGDAASVLKSRGELAFDPDSWRECARVWPADNGRGATWFVERAEDAWVLKHYRRGGWAARLCKDRYVWMDESRVRAVAEWQLLRGLFAQGLPVPRPLAARYQRHGVSYSCDLITERIPEARALSAHFSHAPLSASAWRAAGEAIAQLHRAGLDHADLNAHNVLFDAYGSVRVIDFDRSQVRAAGGWERRNLARLHRSVTKLSRSASTAGIDALWSALLDGYRAARSH